jgi:hypothetical protein
LSSCPHPKARRARAGPGCSAVATGGAQAIGATPTYLYWSDGLSSGLAGSLVIWNTLMILFVRSPFSSKAIGPSSDSGIFTPWMASRTASRVTSFLAATNPFTASMMTRAPV